MKRIPDVFDPRPGDPVLDWVLAGDYIAFRQRDGVGVLARGGTNYVRYCGPPLGITVQPDWIRCSAEDDDELRCWVPLPPLDEVPEMIRGVPSQYGDVMTAIDVWRHSFGARLREVREAIEREEGPAGTPMPDAYPVLPDGMYEATGPHCGMGYEDEPATLRRHTSEWLSLEGPLTRELVRAFLEEHPMRGIVFRHIEDAIETDAGSPRWIMPDLVEGEDAQRVAKATSRSLGITWPRPRPSP